MGCLAFFFLAIAEGKPLRRLREAQTDVSALQAYPNTHPSKKVFKQKSCKQHNITAPEGEHD